MKRLIISLCLLLMILIPVQAQDEDGCTLESHLTVGEGARRLPGEVNNLRESAGLTQKIGQLPGGVPVMLLDGPVCADGYQWWEVSYGEISGWVAEGNPDTEEYWLEPVELVELDTEDDGIFRLYVENEDGTIERAECLQPPDDYEHVYVDYAELNVRTLFMLDYATALYQSRGGDRNFRDAVTQGSYNAGGVAASFGTHDGGGAVDISVRSPVDWSVMTDEIPLMIDSLRAAGFAAWLRVEDQLYEGSIIHIHAIAIGDVDLSEDARAQLDGEYGYFTGYNGLPLEYGGPALDEHGGPIICSWMRDIGFDDMRESGDS